jgi:transcriptional regulator with XRE-family HTH domain
MSIGAKIAKRRKLEGITQLQLADITGLSIRTIQSYECGARIPSLEVVLILCRALGITPGDLLDSFL